MSHPPYPPDGDATRPGAPSHSEPSYTLPTVPPPPAAPTSPASTSPAPPPAAAPPVGPAAGPTVGSYQPGSASVPSYRQPAYPSQPTYAMPPTSAAPSSGPGYPVSGGAYGDPGYPAYGGPIPPATPVPRRRGGVVALAIVAVLLLLATGVLTALYVTKSSEADRTRRDLVAQVSDRNTTIADRDREVEQLKRDLQAAKDEAAQVKQQLTGTQNDRDEQARQKAIIAKCINLLFEAGRDGRVTTSEENAVNAACEEADKYL